jgi:tight adherence protein B
MIYLIPIIATVITIMLIVIAWDSYKGYREQFTQVTEITMSDMFLFIDPQKIFFTNVLLMFVVPIIVFLLFDSLFLAVLGAILALVAPRVAYSVMKTRRRERLIEQLPDVLNMFAGSMRAGSSLQIAMENVVKESPPPLSQELSVVLSEQKLGVSLEHALEGFAARMNVEDVNLMVAAIIIGKEVGGNLSEILERLSTTLRSKASMEGKIKALTSQGILSGFIVGSLPIFLAFVLYQMDPEAMRPMFETFYGWAVMAVVAVLLILGGIVIKKIVTIDV